MLVKRRCDKNKSFNIKFDDALEFAIGAVIFGFICARVYYVLFKLDYYAKNPLEIVQIWHGGIAIYGGIIGVLLYGWYFCKKTKVKYLDLADLLIPYLALAQSLGRWGNFINREAYGYETSVPWKMGIFNGTLGTYIYVHPTFLYEAIVTFLAFIILINLSKNRKFSGQILYTYMIIYGSGRAIVEGFRTDSLMFANFRVSQILSILFVITFGIIYYIAVKRRPKDDDKT